ncbi:MAG: carboxypeptidase-like regulatory domain-containing protein, partial [Vicinamibacteria bacterium]
LQNRLKWGVFERVPQQEPDGMRATKQSFGATKFPIHSYPNQRTQKTAFGCLGMTSRRVEEATREDHQNPAVSPVGRAASARRPSRVGLLFAYYPCMALARSLCTRLNLIGLAAMSFACGSDTATTPTPPVTATLNLTGRVADVTTDRAISGAAVMILDGANASRSTSTDTDGLFRLADLKRGGFNLRVAYTDYDSVFRGVIFVESTSLDIRMRRAGESLSGTWAGSWSENSTAKDIPEITLTQTGSIVGGSHNVVPVSFTGTIADPAALSTVSTISGTITLSHFFTRPVGTCTGTSAFTGTVSFARLVITAPAITFDKCTPGLTPGAVSTNVGITLNRRR